jgi:bifunctional DNase/RNase
MYRVLGAADIAIERVVVIALRDNIFYATLTLKIGGKPHEIDARPSDAITLALYAGAPVFVTPEMLELPIVVRTRCPRWRSSRSGRGSRRAAR